MIDSCNRDAIQGSNDDCIHMGHAIMTFYSALIDLLGRCAPEMHVSDVFKILTIRNSNKTTFVFGILSCHMQFVHLKVAYIKYNL